MLRQLLTELRGAWRFRWVAMVIAWGVGVVGIGVVLSMPDLYEARAQVFVDTEDPLLNMRQGSGIDDAQTKVNYVRRQLLSTPNLEQVARETDLDLRVDTPEGFENLIIELQSQIEVRPGGARGFEANLYEIKYRDPDRRAAERVVQVLLNSFQERSVEGDLRDDLQALAFLDNQMTDYRRRLEQAENRVADFRRRNAGLAPGDGGGFFTRLATLQEELREVRTSLRIARDKRAALAAQVASQAEGGGDGGAASLVELESQVLEAEKRVDELRLIYTDAHPAVISAQETVQALRGRLEQRRDELGPLIGAGAGGAVIENVRIALTQAEIEVAELAARERDLAQRIEELQQKIDVAPQLEADYAGLIRDHTVLQNQYEGLLQRREQLSFDIDRKRQGRQLEFRIIEPPLAPSAPVAPNRFFLLVVVLAAALGAGGAAAYLLHMTKPVYISADAIYQELQLPVLGAVSMAWTARARRRRRGAEAVFAVGIVALAAVFGVVILAMPWALDVVQGLKG
nr:XrtA system polysaccharide chain length determinant [Thioalkalivibrio sp. XN279]